MVMSSMLMSSMLMSLMMSRREGEGGGGESSVEVGVKSGNSRGFVSDSPCQGEGLQSCPGWSGAVASRRRCCACACMRPWGSKNRHCRGPKNISHRGPALKPGVQMQSQICEPTPSPQKENQCPLPLTQCSLWHSTLDQTSNRSEYLHTHSRKRAASHGCHGWPSRLVFLDHRQGMRLRICPRHHLLPSAETVRSPAAT